MRRFYFRLALALGCTVRELLERLDSQELAEWTAYAEIEPWGEERADLRSGIHAAATVNLWRGKGQRPCQASDFMPKFGQPEPRQNLKIDFATYFRGLAIAMGGKVVKRGDNL